MMKKYLIFAIILCCFSLARGQYVPFSPQQFNDETWRTFDNGDPTKRVRFELSGLTTGTTRTLTILDANMTFIDWTAATEALYTTNSGRFDGGVGVGADPSSSLPFKFSGALVTPIRVSFANTSTGDMAIHFLAGSDWLMGIDNSDNDTLKFSQHASALETNTRFAITTAGAITGGTYNGVTLNPTDAWLQISANATADYWASQGYNWIQGNADGFEIQGSAVVGVNDRVLTVTGGDWTLDQSVASGATPTFGSGVAIGTLTLADGSITDSSNAISFGNENLLTTGQAALGTTISAADWLKILTPKHVLNTTGSRWAFAAVARAQATANTSNTLGGFVGGTQTFGTYDYTGTIYGLQGQAIHVGTGTITNASGLIGKVENFNGIAGTITAAKVVQSRLDAEDGTITAGYIFIAETAAVDGGTLTTVYSFYDAGQTNAGTNWGLGINTQSYINANLSIGKNTAPTVALDVTGAALVSSTLGVTGESLFSNKVKFTQVDGNEYIDSLNDGYMDYGATTGHRFNAPVGIGTTAPDSIFHIKANVAGEVGSHPAGQLIIQDPDDTVFGNAVITGYESDGAGNPDQQLWYLGSSSSGNSNIIFLNRRNSKLQLGTNDVSRLTILGNGNVGINETAPQDKLEVNGTVLVKDKLKFTQDDGNEYIDSLADGYLDYGATTAHRFNANVDITGTIRTTADQDWNLGAASAQADFAGDTKIRVTIGGTDYDIVALAVP